MSFTQVKFSTLVKLMSAKYNEKNDLLSPSNVNKYVHHEPLIVYYLRAFKEPNLDILATFATNGCNFNVQGDDGQTPLHLLVRKVMNSNHVKAVEMMLTHGAHPCQTTVSTLLQHEPFIVHLLRTCSEPNFELLLALATRCCNFNVQGHDGQTPLHLLVGKEMNLNDKAVYLRWLLTHGADPTVVDNHGNNVLMLAVLTGQLRLFSKLLTEDKTMIQRLVTQKNKLGRKVLALFFSAPCTLYPEQHTSLDDLLELGCDVKSIDNNGDNCLHHLAQSSNMTSSLRKKWLKDYLEHLIGRGADNSQRNKSGLIPLQIALMIEPIIFKSMLDLELLVPDEDVLQRFVPRPSTETKIKDPFNISVQVWFVAQVTRYGAPQDILSVAHISKYGTLEVIKHIVLYLCARPTFRDVNVAYLNRKWDVVVFYIKVLSPNELNDLKRIMPNLVGQVLLFGTARSARLGNSLTELEFAIQRMAVNGFAIAVNDLKLALFQKKLKVFEALLVKLDSSLDDQIKRKIPDILIQVSRLYLKERIGKGLGKLLINFNSLRVISFRRTFEYILNRFDVKVNYVNSSKDSVIQCILDVCKELVTETEAIQLFDLVANRPEFNVDQTVMCEKFKWNSKSLTERVETIPINLAIKLQKYNMVITLIMAGADVRDIQYDHLIGIQPSAIKLLKLGFHLGIYRGLAEGNLIYGWAQRQPLKSLQELAAMAMRRNCTRTEMKNAIADIVLPDIVNRYLELKHLNLDG